MSRAKSLPGSDAREKHMAGNLGRWPSHATANLVVADTVVSRLGAKGRQAAIEVDALFSGMVGSLNAKTALSRRQLAENG